jgi:hypothetical protein
MCYIGYLLADSTLGQVLSGVAPFRAVSILLLLFFGAIGVCCWGVGLILPLTALRPCLNEHMDIQGSS